MEQTPLTEAQADDRAAWLRREVLIIVKENVGMVEALAIPIADAIVCGLCERMGGREVYIPAPSKVDRDAQIRAMFNGRNLREVMREFECSRAVVYRALK